MPFSTNFVNKFNQLHVLNECAFNVLLLADLESMFLYYKKTYLLLVYYLYFSFFSTSYKENLICFRFRNYFDDILSSFFPKCCCRNRQRDDGELGCFWVCTQNYLQGGAGRTLDCKLHW